MDVFAEIADERRAVADLLSGLSPEQLTSPSLCAEWTVREVAAHLVVPLEVGLAGFGLAMLASGGSFDRANSRLARRHARRPFEEIVDTLRRKAESRFTPPGEGPEAPLTDLLVHGLDIRWPLGIARSLSEGRVRACLTHLAKGGLVPRGALSGLRLEATDVDWSHGSGPAVRGSGDALLLAMSGRRVALDHVDGDGVPTMRRRLTT